MSADAQPASGLAERIAAIEEAYELMLAYASQGHRRGTEGGEVRDFLKRADAALDGIGAGRNRRCESCRGRPRAVFSPFVATLEDDARKARAGIKLSSPNERSDRQAGRQSRCVIHLRALLTDLFLVDEAIASMRE